MANQAFFRNFNISFLTMYPSTMYIPYIPPLKPKDICRDSASNPSTFNIAFPVGTQNENTEKNKIGKYSSFVSQCFNEFATNGMSKYIPTIIGIYHT